MTEREYNALSQFLRNITPIVELLHKFKGTFPFNPQNPVIHYTIHEDNKGCIDIVELLRMGPHTKHIALKYHHFRSSIKDKTISVIYVKSSRQIAKIFIKLLIDSQFGILRKTMMRW